MAYNPPRISLESSRTLKRISWALGQPMTSTSEDIMEFLATVLDDKSICNSCRDRTLCATCYFDKKNRPQNSPIRSLLKA